MTEVRQLWQRAGFVVPQQLDDAPYSRQQTLFGELPVLLAHWLETKQPRVRLLAVSGAQGSGKSTLASHLATALRELGRRVAVLSLDDLYLTKAERAELARRVHPLLATRGVPGTHDLDLGRAAIARALHGHDFVIDELPRFDKGLDDRVVRAGATPRTQMDPTERYSAISMDVPDSTDSSVPDSSTVDVPDSAARDSADRHRIGPVDVLILEGWCLQVEPQAVAELVSPINELERTLDVDGTWRHWVNERLRLDYQPFFALADAAIALLAPSFDVVYAWRAQQEAELPEERRMAPAALRHFIDHYERITRHSLGTLSRNVDLSFALDGDRRVHAITSNPKP